MVHGTINALDHDVKQDMARNIVCAGGSTMFPGFSARLQSEVTNLLPPVYRVNVLAPEDRKYSAFVGGSILSGLGSFRVQGPEIGGSRWITRAEYDECGPSIVRRKCTF